MISEKSSQTLELHKILDQLAQCTAFSAGAELARDLMPATDLDEARTWQRETAEACLLFENKIDISLGGVHDVRDVVLDSQRSAIIEPGILLDIRYTLRRATVLKRQLGRLKGQYPLLADVAVDAEECSDLQEAIERSIDDRGEVKDTASAKLAMIRRELKISFDRLQSKINNIATSKSNATYLQEPLVTMRNGRYVIPLKAENKGKIPGVVHDSSASGATLWIEPLVTVELNNKWREFQLEEEKEIRRILRELTQMVSKNSERICRTVEVLAYIDLTLAKALYAEKLEAVEPTMLPFRPKADSNHPGSTITMRAARHPLLGEEVVPIDVEYGEETWGLVVTGPNTGGKTVALKTVGLLTLMAQCGLHLPAEEATLSVFEGIYADIGDEQSIEQSLSTFSSHMTNIINILKKCDERSLVILDELGAGTDPAEGSALARAILTQLLNRRVTTIVSTHHPELKVYSVETPGIRNASMEFDLETLAPTYRLIIGLPGRSNALEIARRIGLPQEIIDNARGMVATEDLIADDLLDEIRNTREDISRQQRETVFVREDMEEQREELVSRLDRIEDERREVIAAARHSAEDELKEFRKELKRLRRELLMAGMPLEKLRAAEKSVDKMEEQTRAPLDEEAVEMPEDLDWVPKLGDKVFLQTLNSEGVIIEMDEKETLIQVGALRVRAGYSELQRRTRSEREADRVAKRSIKRKKRDYEPSNAPPPPVSSPGLELDLRGQRVEGALQKLDYYIDAAYTSGLPFGRIIHGKGTGRLRQAVREHLQSHPLVSKAAEAHPNEGGSGVTVIHMVPTS